MVMPVKLFPNFTRHHLITHTYPVGVSSGLLPLLSSLALTKDALRQEKISLEAKKWNIVRNYRNRAFI